MMQSPWLGRLKVAARYPAVHTQIQGRSELLYRQTTMLLPSESCAQSILFLLAIVTSIHAAPNPARIPPSTKTKIRDTTISVRSPNPHTLRPRGVGGIPSQNDLEALKHTLAPLTPGWEIEPYVFFAARDDNPLNPIIAQTLQEFYEDILGYASTTTTAAIGFLQAKTEAFRFEMESTVVQNGANVPLRI